MRRREFITLTGGGAIAWPLSVRAQQTTVPVVGFLHGDLADGFAIRAASRRRGLSRNWLARAHGMSGLSLHE